MADRANELFRTFRKGMINLCAVSYLNTKPFLKGLLDEFSEGEMKIETAIPSVCAEIFKSGEADIALVPVGALSEFETFHILPEYCIGAQGRVDSVFLCSESPIESIHTLVPDTHSRTSNLLAQILLRRHFKHEVEVSASEDGSWQRPELGKGYVIIGDKAVPAARSFTHVYDLAYEWQAFTGLPFVFAVWVHRNLNTMTQTRILKAFSKGIQHLDEVAKTWAPVFGLTTEAALYYYQNAISFQLDMDKIKALERFQSEVRSLAVY
jgi:chorismate dehydratase